MFVVFEVVVVVDDVVVVAVVFVEHYSCSSKNKRKWL